MESSQALTDSSISFADKVKGTSKVKRSNFYVYLSILPLLIVLAGFSLTYISPMIAGTFVSRPLIHIHGAMYFTWLLLFITQPLLVRMGYTNIHRKVGVPGFVLAIVMIFIGTAVAITSAKLNRAGGTNLPSNAFLLVPLTDMLLLSVFISLSILNLKRAETHKRLMVLATASILPAAFGRLLPMLGVENIPLTILLVESVVIIAVINDIIVRRKVHPVYIWGGLAMTIVHVIRFPLSESSWWLSIAGWLTS